jgi:hypothetical protein
MDRELKVEQLKWPRKSSRRSTLEVNQSRKVLASITAGGKGILIGGPIGAGAGAAVPFMTGKRDIRQPPETPLKFTPAEPLTINAQGRPKER